MTRRPDVGVAASSLQSWTAEEIRAQLERVLTSQQFRSSRRCQSLLRHVTEHTLSGDTCALKERTLGVEVFGREPDYDTSQDPVVRSTAAEIRKKLAQYYQELAHETEPKIDLHPGSYIVEFHSNGHVKAPSQKRSWRPKLIAVAAAAVVALLAIAVFVFAVPRWKRSDVERFWSPVVQAPGDVMICMGQPVVYNLANAEAQDRIQGVVGGVVSKDTGESKPRDTVPMKDLIILKDRYLALGDAMCLVRVTSLLDKYGKPYRIRGQRSMSSNDMRESPAVLIGAFDNQFTLHAGGELRYSFVKDSVHDIGLVRDRQHPEKTDWKLTGAWPYWDVENDYAIVGRILDVNTDRPVVIAAGITQYGTMGAGEFLTNPSYLSEVIPKLPRNWEKKNLQIVLRVPVVHGSSGHPRVLATHVW